jgi:DNA-directed RNA polymerase subunit RPC12/RpoP
VTETDAMVCRACGHTERASEGYPCLECGTFICLMCNLRGVEFCKQCAAKEIAAERPTA